jgi:hypothetical protein
MRSLGPRSLPGQTRQFVVDPDPRRRHERGAVIGSTTPAVSGHSPLRFVAGLSGGGKRIRTRGPATWPMRSRPSFPVLYAQYPYYPYPPAYYPYYPPPAPAYSPAPSYTPQPSYAPQAGRSGGNIARQLNQQELNSLRAAPVNPPPYPYYPPPPRY